MASLSGKVIAITGAASGIGLSLAKLCASSGAKLALADVQEKLLQDIADEFRKSGTEVVASRVNVTSSQEVDEWVTATVKHFGRLDGAANIAGVEGLKATGASIVDQSNEEWDFILSVNLTGLMYCLRAQLRVMTKGASVVNAASIAGMMGRPGLSAYSASKHGVIGLTRSAAREVGPRGIRVNAVSP
jgi:NAD(P)-dependent dehydrogenase (short-subunit alcohol dehydrogenase family)